MRIIFFGTPDYVVPIVEALHKQFNNAREREFIGVVTQPPSQVGREKKLTYSAVDTFAHNHKIQIFFDTNDLPEADLAICAAYGKIIPQSAIDHFPLGILNIHPSLLPKYRGASPTQAALASGDEETGVTVISMDAQMDHGNIISSFNSPIDQADTNETLRARLFEESVPFLIDLLPAYAAGKIHRKPQDETKATFTRTLKKDDGFVNSKIIEAAVNGVSIEEKYTVPFMKDFEVTPDANFIERYLRALTPWPGVWTTIQNGEKELRLKILKTHVEDQKLVINEVQLEGKNPVSWQQFVAGYPQFSW